MRQFLLAAMSAAALLACKEGRERRVISIDSTLDQPDLTLPDTVTRSDTSVAVATRIEPQVSKTTPPPRRKRPAPARRATPVSDTAVQAYAPGRTVDTASAATRGDTTTVPSDTGSRTLAAARPAPDTALTRSPDTIGQADTASVAAAKPSPLDTMAKTDTITTSPIETATPTVATTTPPPPDTARRPAVAETRAPLPADTTSTAPADTMVASPADTMVASPPEEPAPPSTPPARTEADIAAHTLPIGTEIHAQLDDSITSRRDTVGQIISAHVMQNVLGPNGRTLIPAGAQVRFSITRIRPSRSKNSQGRLGLKVDSIAVDGHLQTVQAETRPVPRELRGRGVTAGDAAKVGGGAAAGAVIGGVVGGNTRGAVIGGVAGAAAGAVLATQTKTRDVVVKAKTPIVFVLTAPLVAAP